MKVPILRKYAPWILVALFSVLGVTYSLVTPVFEASDELSHYPVIQHIATHWELPVQKPGVETLWEQEGSQPPLYYLIGAVMTSWIDTSDLAQIRDRNPHAKLGITLDTDNKNMILHTEAEAFPWKGTVLAVHLLRFFGVLLGSVSVFLTYRIAAEVWPEPPEIPLLTAALVAFNPMFVFIAGSVNNDNLTVALACGIWLLIVRMLKFGITLRRSVILAILCGLAPLTKISGLTLLPLVGVVLLIIWWRTKDWRPVFLSGGAISIGVLAIAGWWYARNIVLYNELLGIDMQVTIAGGRTIGLWDLIRDESHGFWVSYWANFGSVDILADPAVYWFYALLTAAATIGMVRWVVNAVRERRWRDLLIPTLMAGQILLTLGGLISWTLKTMASQGRLMFPAIAALSLFTARGLTEIVPDRIRSTSAIALCTAMLMVTAIVPFRNIAPTYAPPPVVEEIPASAIPVGANWDGIELVAVESPLATVSEGEWVPITLYWRANEKINTRYSVFLHALGREGEEIGKIDSYPGGGSLPTTRFEPGEIVRDTYMVPLDESLVTPTRIRILIGMGIFDGEAYEVIPTLKSDGTSFGNVIVDAGVAYPRDGAACGTTHPETARPLGDIGGFAKGWSDTHDQTVHPGDELPVSLYWARTGATSTDWTVFVQLVGAGGSILDQADAPPLNNDYPTSLWRRPCEVLDIHTLQIPTDAAPGDYQIMIGFYNPADPAFPRAQAVAPDGSPYPNNAIPIASIRVEAR